jgi:hypothetical protein
MIQNSAKRDKLMKEAKEYHHHEVAIKHMKSDLAYIIENN